MTAYNLNTLGLANTSTEVTTAFQTFLDGLASGDTVTWSGNVLLSRTVFLRKSNVTFSAPLGTGGAQTAAFVWTDPNTAGLVCHQYTPNGVYVNNVTFDGISFVLYPPYPITGTQVSDANRRDGLRLDGGTNYTVRNCAFNYFRGSGLNVCDSVIGGTFENLVSTSCRGAAFWIGAGCANQTWTNITANTSGDDGWCTDGGDGPPVRNILLTNFTCNGATSTTGAGAGGISILNSENVIVHTATINDTRAAGVRVAAEPAFLSGPSHGVLLLDVTTNRCAWDRTIGHPSGLLIWAESAPVTDVTSVNLTVLNPPTGADQVRVSGACAAKSVLRATTTGAITQGRWSTPPILRMVHTTYASGTTLTAPTGTVYTA